MGERRCSNPDLSTMRTFRTCDGTGLSAEWDDRCRTLLLLCSGWQQLCVERKCLIGRTPAKTPHRPSLRLRNNRSYLIVTDLLRTDCRHSHSAPLSWARDRVYAPSKVQT